MIQTTTRGRALSLSPPLRLPTHTLFLRVNTLLASLLSVSLWKFISTQLTAQGLVAGHWSSGEDSALSLPRPDFNLWPGTEILLQAAAGRGLQRSAGPEASVPGNLLEAHILRRPPPSPGDSGVHYILRNNKGITC